MSRPLLQLALDHSSLEDAQRDVMQLKDSVDIVEAGTILCLNEGLGAVKPCANSARTNSSSLTGRSPMPVKRSLNKHLPQVLTG